MNKYYIFNFFVIIYFLQFLSVNAFFFHQKLLDVAFVSFVKGPDYFEQFCADKGVTNKQNKNLLAQIYGTYLGILYAMRQHWHCALAHQKIMFKWKCESYRKYLDILYEYLFHAHARHTSIRIPIFISVNDEEFRRTFVDVIESLGIIGKYLFFYNWNTKNHKNYNNNDDDDDEHEILREQFKFVEFKLQKEVKLGYYDYYYSSKYFNDYGKIENVKKKQKMDEPTREEFEQKMQNMFYRMVAENAKFKNGMPSSSSSSSSLSGSSLSSTVSSLSRLSLSSLSGSFESSSVSRHLRLCQKLVPILCFFNSEFPKQH